MRRTSTSSGVADSAKSKARTSSTPVAQLEMEPTYHPAKASPTWVRVNNDALLGRHILQSAAGRHLGYLVLRTCKVINDGSRFFNKSSTSFKYIDR